MSCMGNPAEPRGPFRAPSVRVRPGDAGFSEAFRPGSPHRASPLGRARDGADAFFGALIYMKAGGKGGHPFSRHEAFYVIIIYFTIKMPHGVGCSLSASDALA